MNVVVCVGSLAMISECVYVLIGCVHQNKVHPRERDPRDMKSRGRIRVQLKQEDGTPLMDKFPTSESLCLVLLLLYLVNIMLYSGLSTVM